MNKENPASANLWATEKPIPLLAPVITAVKFISNKGKRKNKKRALTEPFEYQLNPKLIFIIRASFARIVFSFFFLLFCFLFFIVSLGLGRTAYQCIQILIS